MTNEIYIRLDGDNIGDSIELALMNEDFMEAQSFHNRVQEGIRLLTGLIASKKTVTMLLVGCDDILFSIDRNNYSEELIFEMNDIFLNTTGFTLSIGIGRTLNDALNNLKRAKLSGRNKVVDTHIQ